MTQDKKAKPVKDKSKGKEAKAASSRESPPKGKERRSA